MLGRIQKRIASGVISLVVVVISLSTACLAATSPAVTALSPVSRGLRSPVKLVMDTVGNYYVADQNLGIIKYNPYGTPVMTIKISGVPMGVALAQDGNLLVSQGTFVAAYNTADGSEMNRFSGQLKGASGLAVDDITGYIYVADSVANEVQVYTASGQFSGRIGTGARGTGSILPAGKLSMPTGIVFEKSARQLVVADTLNARIQFFDTNGAFVKSIGLMPNMVSTEPLQFVSPQAIAFEYTKDPVPVVSRMYVVDTFQSNIQVIDPTGSGAPLNVSGAATNYIGAYGTANGQLMIPTDAVFDQKNNRLLVVNGFGNIAIFGIDGGTNPVDQTPPTLSIDPVLTTVNVPNITISGSVASGAQVVVASDTAALIGAVSYPTSTSWRSDIVNLAAGANLLTVTAKNALGVSAPAQSVSVSYLLAAPALTVSSSIPAVTNVSRQVLSGTVDAGSVVTVTNGVPAVSGNATVTGAVWSYSVDLSEGLNSIAVTAQKVLSSKAVVAVGITLDTIAPALSVSALSDGGYTSTQVQNISGSVADPGGAAVSVNGVTAVLSGNSFSLPVTLVAGANQISVVAVDAAGNSASVSRTLNFDAARPNITVVEPADNSITATAALTISGTVNKNVSAISVAGVPAAVQGNNWSASLTLLSGLNTIEIVANDASGNTSVKRSITLVDTKPVLAVATPVQDIAVNVPNVNVSGTVSAIVATTVEYSVNGLPIAVPVTNGKYSFDVAFAAQGNYPVTITARDLAGNSSTIVRNVIFDNTPPQLSLNQVSGYIPKNLSGSVEAGSSVVVKDGSLQIGTVQIISGLWTADLTGVNYIPENLLVVATDAAGNSSVKTLVYNYPDGTLNGTAKPTIQDALRAIRLVVNNTVPTAQELAHYDIGPLLSGKPNPNGKIDLVDAILILRKSLGLKSW